MFHGEPDGNFQAYDAKTGELLWQWQTGAGADAPAITYEIDGTQYVAIAAGGVSIQTTSANGDMIWVFSLKGTPGRPAASRSRPPTPPRERRRTSPAPVARDERDQDRGLHLRPAAHHGRGRHQGDVHQYRRPAAQRRLVATRGGWDTGLLAKGESASVTFNRPGTYNFICTPHPSMIGQVIVTGAGGRLRARDRGRRPKVEPRRSRQRTARIERRTRRLE